MIEASPHPASPVARWLLGHEHARAELWIRIANEEGRSVHPRLQAPEFAWNPASVRVLEKVGFVREGVLRRSVTKDGALIDSVMYADTAA